MAPPPPPLLLLLPSRKIPLGTSRAGPSRGNRRDQEKVKPFASPHFGAEQEQAPFFLLSLFHRLLLLHNYASAHFLTGKRGSKGRHQHQHDHTVLPANKAASELQHGPWFAERRRGRGGLSPLSSDEEDRPLGSET